MRAIPWFLLLAAACSGGSSDSSGDDDDALAPPGPPPGGDCVPDDAAGTTWDDAAGVAVPINDVADYVEAEFDGRMTRMYVPDNPRGAMVAFEGGKVHAIGDGVKETAGLEWTPLYNELIQSGFAILATEANADADDDYDWDLHSDLSINDDMQHVLEFLDHVVGTTAMEKSTPLILISFSGAGNFVNILAPAATASGFEVRAADIHDGSTWTWNQSFPTVWVTQSNEWEDDTDITRPDGQGHAATSYEEHVAAGNVGLYLPTPEIPFTPTRMIRNPDYNAVKAAEAFDELVRLEIIDPDGTRLIDILEYKQVLKRFESETLILGPERVSVQLEVVWATHRYNGVHAVQECEFLLEHF